MSIFKKHRAYYSTIALFFSLFYLAFLGPFLFTHRTDFSPTVIKTMEDIEGFYFPRFNNSGFGHFVYNLLQPVFGFFYADAVIFCFWILLSISCAWFLFTLIEAEQEGGSRVSPALAAVIAICFVLFSRRLFDFSVLLSFEGLQRFGHPVELLKTFIRPQGSWFWRFYQPGVGFFGFLLGLVSINLFKSSRLLGSVLLFFSVLVVSVYPWMAAAFLAYLGLSLLEFRRDLRAAVIFLVAGAVLAYLSLRANGNIDPEVLTRAQIVRSRIPDFSVLVPNLILVGCCWLARQLPLGRFAFKVQLANCAAVLSSLVTGYHIQAWHFMHLTVLTIALLIASALSKCVVLSRRLHTVGLLFIIAGVGLAGEMAYWPSYQNYFLLPNSQIGKIETLQRECGPGKKFEYFFSKDIALYWTAGSRTLCSNVVLTGQEIKEVNSKIAARYIAAMVHFGVYPSREALVLDLEKHLANLGTPIRELARNQVDYTTEDRFYNHTIWWLFVVGYNAAGKESYHRELFSTVDYAKELEWIERLDRAGKVIKL